MDIELNKSPIQKIEDSLLLQKGVSLYIKRDDLIHPLVQGNKWRKLKYNLLNAREEGQHTLVTFGGYYSNHIYATAAAAKLFNFKAIGIIRGEEPVVKSETLQFALAQGMQLVYVERATYDRKEDDSFIGELKMRYGPFYYVPEGGTNLLALKGVSEIINEIEIDFDVICTACGTGGTLAGLVAGLQGQKQALGFSALKGTDALTPKVNQLLADYGKPGLSNFHINFEYHFGGYAKIKPELIEFIKDFKAKFDIQLEPVYTGKMLYGVFDLIKQDYFKMGSTIIALHTGGLQGLSGYKSIL